MVYIRPKCPQDVQYWDGTHSHTHTLVQYSINTVAGIMPNSFSSSSLAAATEQNKSLNKGHLKQKRHTRCRQHKYNKVQSESGM